jgi:integrase
LFQPKWKRNGREVKGRVWWMDVQVGGKRYRKSLGLRDKHAAQVKEAEIVRRLEFQAAGIDVKDGAGQSPLGPLVDEYEQEMVRLRRSPAHVAHTRKRVLDLLGKAPNLAAVTPAKIRHGLARLSRQGLTPKTQNAYRVALSGCFTWLIREGRWEHNPVAQVSRVRETEPKRERRALTPEELRALIEAAPEPRATCYVVAATTGARRSELAALRWADVDLDAATLRLRASTAKNRKEAYQPLPEGTVAALRALDGRGTPLAPVFQRVPSTKVLREDLKAAGVPYVTDEGVADLHALRVTYATMLARAGVSLVQAQKLMRHSDPKLTSVIYTRLRLDDAHEAVARIDIGGDATRAANCAHTGQDGGAGAPNRGACGPGAPARDCRRK